MSERTGRLSDDEELALEFDLDAPPEKIWRAVTIAEFRERWLPDADLADPEPVAIVPGEQVRYRMRDDEPPFVESIATFHILPNGSGGTTLRIVHRIADDSLSTSTAANNNDSCLMQAA